MASSSSSSSSSSDVFGWKQKKISKNTKGLPKEEMRIKKRKKYDENFDIIIIIIIIIIFERSLSLSLSLLLVVVVVVSSRVVGVQSNAKPSSTTTREL